MRLHQSRILKNQRGYMAVFIALIFQVLFVFFAMVVNIGLMIHDKINLQNSADLAAYYAAGKQAEMLNAIAHSNYQIRQSWKLLAWRIRVLGNMAAHGHPMLSGPTEGYNDNAATDRPINSSYPLVCTAFAWWGDLNQNDTNQNFCKNGMTGTATFPDPPPPINIFLPYNVVVYQVGRQLQQKFGEGCEDIGKRNFLMSTRWLGAYKGDMLNRVRVINAYRDKLSSSTSDFDDVEGESTRDGAEKTLLKNLTRSNQENMEFKFYNSLGTGQKWLNKIAVVPEVYYADSQSTGGGGGSSCRLSSRHCYLTPHHTGSFATEFNKLKEVCAEPQSIEADEHSTVGFEKNPWVMAYVGVEVRVKGRRPFAPFGKPVEIVARAFAKPFGGRIGPWLNDQWPQGSSFSQSSNWVDPLLPSAKTASSGGGSSSSGSGQGNPVNFRIPNYSRYPGDKIGLHSELSLALMRKALNLGAGQTGKLFLKMWGGLPFESFTSGDADVLAWNWNPTNPPTPEPNNVPKPAWIRSYEIAAIVPDLFDVTYYSIDPQFYPNYVERANNNFFGDAVKPRPDLGYRQGHPLWNKFNVIDQIAGFSGYYDARATYIIRNAAGPTDPMAAARLLTGWAPNQLRDQDGEFDYEFPDSVFGKCPGGFKLGVGRGIPGGCVNGGRTGYSVKLVSENYLQDDVVQAGGGISGAIQNPPPADF